MTGPPRKPFVYWSLPGERDGTCGMPDAQGREFIRTFGGYVQIDDYRVTYRVTRRDRERWEVSFRGAVGTDRPVDLFEPLENFSRYDDAIREAKRLARTALAGEPWCS